MLDGMRKASQGAIGKLVMTIVMGLIIVSFVIWGVGDMLRGFTSTRSPRSARRDLRRSNIPTSCRPSSISLQRQLRQPLTPAAGARARARRAGARPHDRRGGARRARARARPRDLRRDHRRGGALRSAASRALDGQFDRARFDAYLRDAGLSERGFFAEQRDVYLRQQIQYSLVDGLHAPKALVDALQATQRTRRARSPISRLAPPPAGDIPPPSDEALKSYFDGTRRSGARRNIAQFDALRHAGDARQAATRSATTTRRAQYEKDKATKYSARRKSASCSRSCSRTRPRRTRPTPRSRPGTTFDDIAKARNLTDADLDLGEVTKTGVVRSRRSPTPPSRCRKAACQRAGQGPVRLRAGAGRRDRRRAASSRSRRSRRRSSRRSPPRAPATTCRRCTTRSRTRAARASRWPRPPRASGLEARSHRGVDRHGHDRRRRRRPTCRQGRRCCRPCSPPTSASTTRRSPTKDRGYVWFAVTQDRPGARPPASTRSRTRSPTRWRAEETDKRLARRRPPNRQEAQRRRRRSPSSPRPQAPRSRPPRTSSAAAAAACRRQRRRGSVRRRPPTGAGSAPRPDGRVVFKVTADRDAAARRRRPRRARRTDRRSRPRLERRRWSSNMSTR